MKKIGNYYVLKDGRIGSCKRKRWLKPFRHDYKGVHQHLKVKLSIGGVFGNIDVHRVIYETFNIKLPYGMEIDHIDNNPLNNNLSNLQALTSVENLKKMHKGKETRKNEKNVKSTWSANLVLDKYGSNKLQ